MTGCFDFSMLSLGDDDIKIARLMRLLSRRAAGHRLVRPRQRFSRVRPRTARYAPSEPSLLFRLIRDGRRS